MIRPKEILGLAIERAKPWTAKEKAYVFQQNLELGAATSKQLRDLEQIPWKFSYRFTCRDDACVTTHKLSVIDWEIGESYRKWSVALRRRLAGRHPQAIRAGIAGARSPFRPG